LKLNSHPRRKAISGILAALIFFAMLFTAGMSFILYTFSSYNTYNQAQVQAVQNQQQKSSEDLSLRACDATHHLPSVPPWQGSTCSVSGSHVGVWVQNIGSVTVTLQKLWIFNSSKNSVVPKFTPTGNPVTTPALPIVLAPGSVVVVDSTFSPGASTDKFAIFFVTSMGNQFQASYPPPPQPNATPSISLSPNSGPSGTSVTVSGANLAFSSPITIKWDGNPGGMPSCTTNSSGSINSGCVLTVGTASSSATAGVHSVSASDGSNSPSAVFTVTSPTIQLSPNVSPQGTPVTVTVTGNGFSPISSISTITFNGVIQTTNPPSPFATSATGAFSASFSVSSLTAAGSYPVVVTDAKLLSASAIYTITSSATNVPTISLNPALGPKGSTVQITGSNFGVKTVTFTFDGAALTTNPAVVTPTSGSFTASFTVPNTVPGPHTVTATDGTSTASTTFTVTSPTITLTPAQGLDGATISVVGSYFAPTSTITFKFDGAALSTTPAVVTSSSGGSFGSSSAVTFKIPNGAVSGAHTVAATDASGGVATYIFLVTPPTITLNPVSGANGATVTIAGGVFTSSSTTAITFDGSATGMPTCSTGAGGTINAGCTFTVPTSAVTGAHIVTATDPFGNTASATFTIACSISNNCVASSAFGIGYISFNFNTFYYYTLSGGSCVQNVNSYPSGTCTLSAPSLAYTIPAAVDSKYLVFAVTFTNVDPNQRDLIFDGFNYMQAVLVCAATSSGACGSNSGISAPWTIGCVSANTVQPLASCQTTENGVTGIKLSPGVPTTVYFVLDQLGTPPNVAGSKWGNMLPLTPVFFLVHGSLACTASSNGCTVGTAQLFGENIPFTSVLWS
jgi:flagellin-like protein